MKTNMHKKAISIFMAVVLLLTTAATAGASVHSANATGVSAQDKQRIVQALSYLEPEKDRFSLSGVNFSALCVGAPVATYLYQDNGFQPSDPLYPLLNGGELAAWAVAAGEGDDRRFQVTTGLVEELGGAVDSDTPFALVYDRNGCYLCTADGFTLLLGYDAVEDRSVLNASVSVPEGMVLSSLAASDSLNYTTPLTRAYTYNKVFPEIRYMSQDPYNNLCWAASVACIVYQRQDKLLTAKEVAVNHFKNTTNFNRTVTTKNAAILLREEYQLNFTEQTTSLPHEADIYGNINRNYPIYGVFAINGPYSDPGHIGVIYGIDIFNGYITVMDPAYTFVSATLGSDGRYTYKNTSNGNTYTLNTMLCMYWGD